MTSKTNSVYETGQRFIHSKTGLILGTAASLITLLIGIVCLLLDLHKSKLLVAGSIFVMLVGILGLYTSVVHFRQSKQNSTN